MEPHQIHFPVRANEAYWDGLGDCHDGGLVKGVGVSNYDRPRSEPCQKWLPRHPVALKSNTISLAYPFANSNGLKRPR